MKHKGRIRKIGERASKSGNNKWRKPPYRKPDFKAYVDPANGADKSVVQIIEGFQNFDIRHYRDEFLKIKNAMPKQELAVKDFPFAKRVISTIWCNDSNWSNTPPMLCDFKPDCLIITATDVTIELDTLTTINNCLVGYDIEIKAIDGNSNLLFHN